MGSGGAGDPNITGAGQDGFWLTVGAAAVAAVLVVWGGAGLAAVVSGEPFSGRFGDAARAAVHLVPEWRDPRLAWGRLEVRASLPGPAVYWACTAVCAVLAGLLEIGRASCRARV